MMSKMVPQSPSPQIASAAERKLFPKFQGELGSEWTVLHSVGIARHTRKPWSEVDFVLIGPPGVFCLEVKGGGVRRKEGVWEFENRYGAVSTKHEGPFKQVAGGSTALYNFLKETVPAISQAVLGYGVCFPDIQFQRHDPEVISDLVYDSDDYDLPLSLYVNRICDYWRTRLGARRQLTSGESLRIIAELRGDFDYRPTLAVAARDIGEQP